MNRFSKLAAVLAVLPILAVASPVFADSPGQLEGGSIVYLVKNKTQNGSYSTSASAACGDEVRYSIRLHNTSFGGFSNVDVKVSLPSAGGTSTMTATTNLGGISGTSGSASVNTPSGSTQSYINGTTTLYDENGNVIKALPDTITNSGVSIGALAGSTTRFVNFNAKVNCPEQPKSKAKISIRKIAEDASGKELSAVPTNVFTFKVTCDGTTTAVTYNSTPQAAGECTVGSTVTITENAVNGWVALSPTTQTFTVTENGLTVVFKNRQKAVVTTTTTEKTTPTELPNTGAGSAIALFTGVSALAGAGHFMFRRFYN